MARIPAAERRSALVQAALRVIATHGVAAATTRAIVAEAGMSLASFHYAFKSRDELISELITFVIDHEILAATQGLATGADLRTTIRDGLHAYLRLVEQDPLRELAMFELVQYAMRTPELGAAARQQYDAYYRAAAGLLVHVAEQNRITWRRPIDEMARILITLSDGLTLGWLVDRDSAQAESVIEFATEALAAMAVPHPATTLEEAR
ncbi:AcrR family transcriptional regulator [Allocatelliglobosispora scoriae]|uniref:AcrR family transcriptional regulator n=1 Tax=Allocatelliglobosispora scoriae TaxID=643052 RepID=A0A841BT58_9ACTN|nr:TetR family transcriptional regulator [Allocatelliglobosispora scoriae]MBB5869981.1 AcrR family transcriptional regulator [Allocatelliglobosispora scoriae]